jgi:uncharacterized protein YeeX (DUF496 family)
MLADIDLKIREAEKRCVPLGKFNEELDYVTGEMRDEIMGEVSSLIENMAGNMVMTAIQETQDTIMKTVEGTVLDHATKM